MILRFCHAALADARPIPAKPSHVTASPARPQRSRRVSTANGVTQVINGVEATKTPSSIKGQYSISLTLADLAKACHLRLDDVVSTMTELGFLRHRRRHCRRSEVNVGAQEGGEGLAKVVEDEDEWADVEVVVSREDVQREWEKWKVRPNGVLDETCVLL